MKGQNGRNVCKHGTTSLEEQTWAQPSLFPFFFGSFCFHTESLGLNTEVLQGGEKSQINIKRNITSYLHTPLLSTFFHQSVRSHTLQYKGDVQEVHLRLLFSNWPIRSRVRRYQQERFNKSHFLQDLLLATGWEEKCHQRQTHDLLERQKEMLMSS